MDVRLKNNLAKDISLEKITDLNGVMAYTFDKGTAIQAKQSKHIVVPSFHMTGEYDFYTVTPVLRYTAAGKRNQYSLIRIFKCLQHLVVNFCHFFLG
nr:hypothetical protein [Bacillus haynesii]